MSEKAKQKRILLVDDNKNVLAVLSDFLKISGYAVCEAKDAQGAVRIVKEEVADLSLIDLRMPGMNGINLMLFLVIVVHLSKNSTKKFNTNVMKKEELDPSYRR